MSEKSIGRQNPVGALSLPLGGAALGGATAAAAPPAAAGSVQFTAQTNIVANVTGASEKTIQLLIEQNNAVVIPKTVTAVQQRGKDKERTNYGK